MSMQQISFFVLNNKATAWDHSTNTGPILPKATPDSGINLTEGSFCPCNDNTGLSQTGGRYPGCER